MRLLTIVAAAVLAGACARVDAGPPSPPQQRAIADSLEALVTATYDLSRPGDPVARLMSLYPDSGRVVSAGGGVVTTARDSIEAGIRAFWTNVGANMRDPKWTWDALYVDVLSRDAAVLTASYRVPHLTPAGQPHVIAGAWTATFQRRGGRWVVVQEHLSDVRQ